MRFILGGIPAPNPSYPFPIKSVTGNNNVVVHNKNLFNGILELGIINGTTGQNETGGIYDNYIRNKDYIGIQPSTEYVLSTNNSSVITDTMFIYYYGTNYSYISQATISYNSAKGGYYFTTLDNARYIRFRPRYTTTDTTIPFQLEKGSTATTYEEHKEQTLPLNLGTIELNGINTYKNLTFKAENGNAYYDSLTAEQKALLTYGKWYKHEEIEKVVFNGTEDIRKNNASDSNNWVYYYKQTQYDYSVISQCKCNYLSFVGGGISNIANKTANGFMGSATYQVTYFNIGSILETNTLEALKTLLTQLYNNNNPLTFYLVYATPQDIEITDTNLISQLEEINKMQGYNGTTIITSTYDTNNAQMILSVSGLKGE